MATKPLAITQPPDMSFPEMMMLGEQLAKSGFFADVSSAAKALVKILAGREMGFGPIASMTDVHIIEGKPAIGAHLRAASIKRSDKYDYDIVRLDRLGCEVSFFEHTGDPAGTARKGKKGWTARGSVAVTLDEFVQNGTAVGKNGQLKTNWQRSPDDMLFARAISKGYRRFTPDLTGGVLAYDPDEMTAQDAEVLPPPKGPGPLEQPLLLPAPAVPPIPLQRGFTDEQKTAIAEKVRERGLDGDDVQGWLKFLGVPALDELREDLYPLALLALDKWWSFDHAKFLGHFQAESLAAMTPALALKARAALNTKPTNVGRPA